jgi:predicted ABC-type ATPase
MTDTSPTTPVLYMIGGPNGAGKTTAAMRLMPGNIDCYEYVNADAIAAALSPFRPAEVSIEAGRVMLKRIRELAQRREDFAFETTMASRSFAPFLIECRAAGYKIHVVYLWLRTPELAIERVVQRVLSGGHAVPEETIRSRYARGISNFFQLYMPSADTWACYDNSESTVRLIAEKTTGEKENICDAQTWKSIQEAAI